MGWARECNIFNEIEKRKNLIKIQRIQKWQQTKKKKHADFIRIGSLYALFLSHKP